MDYSNNRIVTLQLERIGSGVYSFTSTDDISDGDHLWDRNMNVVYDIRDDDRVDEVGFLRLGYLLIAHADPDPLFQSSTLQLEVL
jgi:hypothetical protein